LEKLNWAVRIGCGTLWAKTTAGERMDVTAVAITTKTSGPAATMGGAVPVANSVPRVDAERILHPFRPGSG
jgi:hypothetical protein